MTIHILSEETINKIAAGEVIENPASVIKELVENSIDAGATKIAIEIKGGGFVSICVRDDGCGMSPDDALLSLERHATSKIVSASDLFALHTMGFRGEALASIAAISKMTLETAQEGKSGTRILVAGGKILEVQECARTRGTSMTVQTLFYNTPARRKFQKSEIASSREITKMVKILSLAYPHVQFSLLQNGENVFAGKRSSHLSFLEALRMRLDEHFTKSFLPIQVEGEILCGFMGAPQDAKLTRQQFLYLDGRAITSYSVAGAVKNGFATMIDERAFPPFLLHMKIPEEEVDVNVHPQKKEVRLLNEESVLQKVQQEVAAALGSSRPKMALSDIPLTFSNPFVFEETPTVIHSQELALPIDPLPQILGQFSHFLFVQEREELMIIDLSAAVRQIFAEEWSEGKTFDGERLLTPLTYSCSAEEADLIEGKEALFLSMGMALQRAGKDAFFIDSLPSFLPEKDVERFIAEVLSSGNIKNAMRTVEKKAFTRHEAEAILQKLLENKRGVYCPKGEKIIHRLSEEGIKKLFCDK